MIETWEITTEQINDLPLLLGVELRDTDLTCDHLANALSMLGDAAGLRAMASSM